MPIINYKLNLVLTWSAKCVITNSTTLGTFAITSSNFLLVILSTENNTKLLEKFNSRFRRNINWEMYQ